MATLNENIPKIEEGTLLYNIYNRLLSGMLAAQDETLPDYTSGEYVIETTDENGVVVYTADEAKINASINEYRDITIKNSAYLLASTMSDAIEGGSGGSGGEEEKAYVLLGGDTMTGHLNTLYGFTAGYGGVKILDVYNVTEGGIRNIVEIDGELHLGANGLYINDSNVMSYDGSELVLAGDRITLQGAVEISDGLTVGSIVLSDSGISYGAYDFYHEGNANKADVSWTMLNATVYGNLLVNGTGVFKGKLSALYGFELGTGGAALLYLDTSNVFQVSTGISVSGGASIQGDVDVYGNIQLKGINTLYVKNAEVVSLSAPNKALNLGDDDTAKLVLQTGLYDDDGEYELLSKFGDGYFPNSFKASHSLGDILIETYRSDTDNTGVVISKWLRLNSLSGPGFHSDGTSVNIHAPFRYVDATSEVETTETRYVSLKFAESTSLFAPLNRKSASLFLTTDADFYVLDKPLEGKNSIGIANSHTRLLDNQLFFGDSVYWQGLEDGVKHYGNAYMAGSVGSVSFSSGFAGNGWRIYANQLTGNISATFDELTIRKKMRIYELEVQKQSITNGSLWVSDTCSGDIVEEVA